MTFTYNSSSTARDQVRLLISDIDENNAIFQDEEIAQFLLLKSNNVFKASALALRTIAANQVMVLKVITLLDLTTDGAAVAAELRQQATALEQQSKGSFAVSELALTSWSIRDKLVS